MYCWPDEAMKKKQPPLVLRLLCFHDGRGEVYLVTNVLDEKELTTKQASLIYRRRWGIELQFRSLKQTYGRAKLRARTPEIAEVELHWSLLGLTMLQLLAMKEQTRAGEPADKTSIAAVLRIIRSMMAGRSEKRPASASLGKRLQNATTDSYQRHGKKQSRNYPRRKEEPCTGRADHPHGHRQAEGTGAQDLGCSTQQRKMLNGVAPHPPFGHPLPVGARERGLRFENWDQLASGARPTFHRASLALPGAHSVAGPAVSGRPTGVSAHGIFRRTGKLGFIGKFSAAEFERGGRKSCRDSAYYRYELLCVLTAAMHHPDGRIWRSRCSAVAHLRAGLRTSGAFAVAFNPPRPSGMGRS